MENEVPTTYCMANWAGKMIFFGNKDTGSSKYQFSSWSLKPNHLSAGRLFRLSPVKATAAMSLRITLNIEPDLNRWP